MIILWLLSVLIILIILFSIIYGSLYFWLKYRITDNIYDFNDPDYLWAREIVKKKNSSITFGIKFFPPNHKIRITILYAVYLTLKRFVSDHHREERINRVQLLRAFINSVYQYTTEKFFLNATMLNYDKNIIRALQIYKSIIYKYSIPKERGEMLFSGFEDDIFSDRMITYEQLINHCMMTGGSIGIICCYLLDLDSSFVTSAKAMGMVARLTSIKKNIKNDVILDKIYIPDEVLDESRVSFASGIIRNQKIKYVDKYFAEVSEPFYLATISGLSKLPFDLWFGCLLMVYLPKIMYSESFRFFCIPLALFYYWLDKNLI